MFHTEVFNQNVFPRPEIRGGRRNPKATKLNKINALAEDLASSSVIKLMRKTDAKFTVLKDGGCSGERKSIIVFSPLYA